MKVEFIFKIFSGIKNIPFDPVEFFFKKVSVFCFFLRSLLFSNCQLAMFFSTQNQLSQLLVGVS